MVRGEEGKTVLLDEDKTETWGRGEVGRGETEDLMAVDAGGEEMDMVFDILGMPDEATD